MTMGVINAVAEFERDLLIERTQSGLARAKAEGKALGRSKAADAAGVAAWRRENGPSIRDTMAHFGISRATVARYCAAGGMGCIG
jgi:putative DNA-invertase from lambdoid prophage Rac